MGNRDEADSSKEIVLRFGLKIAKVIKGKNVQFQIASHKINVLIPRFFTIFESVPLNVILDYSFCLLD